jgi:hypothetical protein
MISRDLFTEKQYREFIGSYSVDERINPLEFVLNLFKKKDETPSIPEYVNALKPTISLKVLEENTAQFVKGKTDAKRFYGVLNVAFGPKLSVVLPEILANLPVDKASALSKLIK